MFDIDTMIVYFRCQYYTSESEETPQESSCSQYTPDAGLPSNAGLSAPTFPDVPWSRSETYPLTIEG